MLLWKDMLVIVVIMNINVLRRQNNFKQITINLILNDTYYLFHIIYRLLNITTVT